MQTAFSKYNVKEHGIEIFAQAERLGVGPYTDVCCAERVQENIKEEQDMSSFIFGNEIALTERTLDLLWLRQNITLNNIANDDTPGFKSQYLTFEDALAEQVKGASATGSAGNVRRAISSVPALVRTTENESSRLDGNNVDMSQEQIDLVKTAYQYQYLVNSINSEISRLQEAAKPF